MKIRIRIGGFLLFLYLPPLNPQQLFTNVGFLISIYLHAAALGLFIIYALFFAKNDEPKILPEGERAVLLKLLEQPEIEKAKEILQNSKPNDIKPKTAKTLSDRNSETPEELKNSQSVAVVENPIPAKGLPEERSEEIPKEDPLRNNVTVLPFLKDENRNKSVFERLTGQPDQTAQNFGGQTYELNTYKWEFAPYMIKWKNRMTNNWYKITSKIMFNPFAPVGQLQVYVKMDRQGRLMDSKVVEFNCDKSFVAPAYASVVNSFPLDPLPEAFPDPFLETTWTISITNN